MPFVLHEVAEYVVAAALIAAGLHVSGSAELLLVVVGVAMLLLGALTSGRLGAYHLLSRRAHHVGDLVLVVVLALSPVVAHRSLHVAGIVLAEVVALLLLRIERGTSYGELPRPVPTGTAPGPAPASTAGATRAAEGDAAARIGAAAGATAATAVAAAAQLAPVAGRAARVGARGLGVVAGMTKRAARERAAARRGAGRA
ncbi:MAG TPA: hypothetical protein VMV02_02280 [Acidimicrobiales bacterium]|nr:hypothetical protein [Acidimicrobiales bacterium]